MIIETVVSFSENRITISFVQSEMEAFRHEATDEKASTRRMSAQLMQLRADFDQLDANYRRNDEDISQKIYQ